MLCAMWYHLHNLKNVKNSHGGVLLLLKLQAVACNIAKSNTPPWMLSHFLNYTNGIKSRKTPYIVDLEKANACCGTENPETRL